MCSMHLPKSWRISSSRQQLLWDYQTILLKTADISQDSDSFPYRNIRLLQDGQTIYIVNVKLLRARLKLEVEDLHPWTRFCHLDSEPRKVCTCNHQSLKGKRQSDASAQLDTSPAELNDVLVYLSLQLSDSNIASHSLILPKVSTRTSVALAGFLLEYPISYVPSEDEERPLDRLPLRVFECFLCGEHERWASLPRVWLMVIRKLSEHSLWSSAVQFQLFHIWKGALLAILYQKRFGQGSFHD